MSLNVREHSAGCIVTGKTGLTHTRTIVNDKLFRLVSHGKAMYVQQPPRLEITNSPQKGTHVNMTSSTTIVLPVIHTFHLDGSSTSACNAIQIIGIAGNSLANNVFVSWRPIRQAWLMWPGPRACVPRVRLPASSSGRHSHCVLIGPDFCWYTDLRGYVVSRFGRISVC